MSGLNVVVLLWAMGALAAQADEPISFNRHIRPILAENCFACHGFDPKHREAGLRLDTFEGATQERDGIRGVTPGDPTQSELWLRVQATEPERIMPPPHANKPPLSAAQRELLKRWILGGAQYERHWSFEQPTLPVTVHAAGDDPILEPIDSYVGAKLHQHGLTFAPEAEHSTLIRRVAFDLTALPPTAEMYQLPYEVVVDQLLASPHFGEHMAAGWLDVARYADTNGYFSDKPRQMWLWRDWVIRAFNENMPFDQFTIEQLAGDLLPNATESQRIATGFNRNHMANNETGSIDEEFRVEYVVDRVNTTSSAWLGLTVGCAQCHDHKFDPLSQREYYELFAFFNNVPEQGVIQADNPPPLLSVPTVKQQRQLEQAAAEKRAAVEAFEPLREHLAAKTRAWEQVAAASLPTPPAEHSFQHSFDGEPGPDLTASGTALKFEQGLRGQAARFDATQHLESNLAKFNLDEPWTIGLWVKSEGSLSCPLSLIEPAGDRRGLELILQKGRAQVNLVNRWGASAIEVATVESLVDKSWHQIVVTYDGLRKASGVRIYFDGKAMALEVKRDILRGTLVNREPLRIGRRDAGLGFYGLIDEVRLVPRAIDDQRVGDWFWGERLRGIIETPVAQRPASAADVLQDYYIDHFAEGPVRQARGRVKETTQAEQTLLDAVPTVLVMQEMDQPRPTYVLDRGQYDKPLEQVTPDVPRAIAPWPAAAPRNRLGFAQWLVSKDNPLTARVAVNRLWQQCFGEGLVRTLDDFGAQGELPTHPELLDWLAVVFRDNGWDVKAMLRTIVLSRTYRQQSAVRIQSDPENRLLSRGPSGRLSAESLRDQSLAVSGLLTPTIGGPSVKPYQPPGLWEAVSYDGEDTYVMDRGDGRWRRSLYTFVKRQSPPPTLLLFDGPTREKCTVRRARTNTPLQALVLLNDPVFVESAQNLSARVLRARGNDADRLRLLFRLAVGREMADQEVNLLRGLLERQRQRFARTPAAVQQLLNAGTAEMHSPLDPGELAAWTVVSQAVLNLDEAITKR